MGEGCVSDVRNWAPYLDYVFDEMVLGRDFVVREPPNTKEKGFDEVAG